jgi:hypothetical protein
MKTLLALVVLCYSCVAFAESYRLGRFQNQATKFAAVESQMG